MLLEIIARILIGSIFYVSAVKSAAFEYDKFSKYLESMNVPFAYILSGIILGFKFIAGLMLIFSAISNSNTLTAVTAGSLATFTGIATIIAHNAFADPSQFNHMMKNISIIGALLLLMKD